MGFSLTGFLSGVNSGVQSNLQKKLEMDERQKQRDLELLQVMSKSENPDIRAMAVAGMMEVSSGKGYQQGFMGKLLGKPWDQHPVFGKLTELQKEADKQKNLPETSSSLSEIGTMQPPAAKPAAPVPTAYDGLTGNGTSSLASGEARPTLGTPAQNTYNPAVDSAPVGQLDANLNSVPSAAPQPGAMAQPVRPVNTPSQISLPPSTPTAAPRPVRPTPLGEDVGAKITPPSMPTSRFNNPGSARPETNYEKYGHLTGGFGLPTPEYSDAIGQDKLKAELALKQQFAVPKSGRTLELRQLADLTDKEQTEGLTPGEKVLKEQLLANLPAQLTGQKITGAQTLQDDKQSWASEEATLNRGLKEKLANQQAQISKLRIDKMGATGTLIKPEEEPLLAGMAQAWLESDRPPSAKYAPHVYKYMEDNNIEFPLPKPIKEKNSAFADSKKLISTVEERFKEWQENPSETAWWALSDYIDAASVSIGRTMGEKGAFSDKDQNRWKSLFGANGWNRTIKPEEGLRRIGLARDLLEDRQINLLKSHYDLASKGGRETLRELETERATRNGIDPPPLPSGYKTKWDSVPEGAIVQASDGKKYKKVNGQKVLVQ